MLEDVGLTPTIVFLSEVKKQACNSGVVRDKLTIEISKAEEGLYVLDFGGSQSCGNAIKLHWIHG